MLWVSRIVDAFSDMVDKRQDFISRIKHVFVVALSSDDFSFLSFPPVALLHIRIISAAVKKKKKQEKKENRIVPHI